MKWAALAALACGCSGADPYETAVLADHPVAYWRLDDAPGARFAYDDSGHGHDAVIVGGVTLGAPGAFASAKSARFDTDQWIAAGDEFGFTNNDSFSLELWLDPDAVDIWRPILIKGDYFNFNDGYWLMTNTDLIVASQSAASQTSVDVPLQAGQWTHLVAVFDGLDVDLYLDGVLAKTGSFAARWDPSPVPFSIAGPDDAVHGGTSFQGTIQDVAVYDHALTAAQIGAHFKAAQ